MKSTQPTILLAPDSFKGSLTAPQAAAAMQRGILRVLPSANILLFPMADGGEGTLDALLSTGGDRHTIPVHNAAGATATASIGILPDGTGVIEAAEIVGLTDVAATTTPVADRTTTGIGDAIKFLLNKNCHRIYIGLGGSSTNDAGAGLLTALGARLLDNTGQQLTPTPNNLAHVATIDITHLDTRLRHCKLIAMSDVDNRLTGPSGATHTFGPQKGVLPAQLQIFDAALAHFATLAETAFATSAQHHPGAGAAGGLGFALLLLNAHLLSGAEVVSDLLHLDEALQTADWLITGEGRSDHQTLHGKAPYIVCKKASRHQVPTALLSGSIDPEALPALTRHFASATALVQGSITVQQAISQAEPLLEDAAEHLANLWSMQ